jgi:hypothetical protein
MLATAETGRLLPLQRLVCCIDRLNPQPEAAIDRTGQRLVRTKKNRLSRFFAGREWR